MIIVIGGAPCSGKSTLTRNTISELGSAEYVEPMKLFPCEKRGDVLIVRKYPDGETFGGTDKMSYGAIPKFLDFINQEAPKHKHIILEGDRFFRAKDIEWLIENHNAKVFVLTVSGDEENRRHIERKDTQTEKWLKGRRTQIRNIMTNPILKDELEIRPNESERDSQNIKNEIMEIVTGSYEKKWSANFTLGQSCNFANDNVDPDSMIYFERLAS
jgi:hypothetical protein